VAAGKAAAAAAAIDILWKSRRETMRDSPWCSPRLARGAIHDQMVQKQRARLCEASPFVDGDDTAQGRSGRVG